MLLSSLRSVIAGRRVGCRWFGDLSKSVDVSSEVMSALDSGKPVVSLESTIITHGMPHPSNVETAVEVESIVRREGAVPATIAIIDGRVKVGLTYQQLAFLAQPGTNCVKTSRRDFPYVLSKRLNGGTTVSGTLMIAGLVGIKVFVTGGIGGVHRHGETTMDVSADLIEMGKQPIMVVSSGVKSILDIGRTLEFLETQGVCVMSYSASKDFPAFYSRKSGFSAPYNVSNPTDAARALFECHQVGARSGILLAVPIPEQFSLDNQIINESIDRALKDAENSGVCGKEVTPFVLKRVSQITSGSSLKSNIALIKNNALVGAQISVEYERIVKKTAEKSAILDTPNAFAKSDTGKITVVGGSVLDCVMTLKTELKADGRTLPGKISQTPGGVGRNMADSLGKLRPAPVSFISAVANDQFGQFLMRSLQHVDTGGVLVVENGRTACYGTLVDCHGDAKIGIGDMEVHQKVTPCHVAACRGKLDESSLIVVDGNMPEDTIKAVLELSLENQVPVWFEPTDVLKAAKPFSTGLWTKLSCISPNINELREMAKAAGVLFGEEFDFDDINRLMNQLLYLSQPLVHYIPVVMVTMGKLGILMVTRCSADVSLINVLNMAGNQVFARHYPCVDFDDVANSLGAGDNTAAGFIDGLLRGCVEPECMDLGQQASKEALQSFMAVPEHFKAYDAARASLASFHEIPVSGGS